MGFVEKVVDVAGERDGGAELVTETERRDDALEAVEISAEARGAVSLKVRAGVVDEHARAKAAVAPGETGIGGAGDKTADLIGAASDGAAEVAVRGKQRVVGRDGEAAEETGEKGELPVF